MVIMQGGGGAGAGGGGGGASHGGANAEEMRQLREELAETRASKKSNDKELSEAIEKKAALEKKVSDLNEQLMRLHFEKREGEADKSRAAEEVYRLSQELANSRKALEMKNKELSIVEQLGLFGNHRRGGPEK